MPILVSILTFATICIGSIGTMIVSARLPAHHRDAATDAVFRQVGGVFALMTSLVFGLTINSAKNTYEAIDTNVHVYATTLIVLDRTLRQYGIGAAETRSLLATYTEEAIAHPGRKEGSPGDTAGQALARFGDALATLRPAEGFHESILLDARRQYGEIVERRWSIIEQSDGTIPAPMVAMLVAWLTVVFANFGFRAPANAVVVGLFVASAALIAASFYLVLDMNVPFEGIISISDEPLRRALTEMRTLS